MLTVLPNFFGAAPTPCVLRKTRGTHVRILR